MDIAEVLKLADELVFAQTGNHLDYLQEAILRGTVEGQKYSKIAEETYSSIGHIRDVGSELWQILSEALGKDITKANFTAILKNGKIDNYQLAIIRENVTLGKNVTVNHNVNICAERARSPTQPSDTKLTLKQPRIDLGDAPESLTFYDRTSELSTLKEWLISDRCRLITLFGLSGIGKSALALKLIEDIQSEFDCIIWRSLSNASTLSNLQTEIKQFFSQSQPTPLPTVIDYFRTSRCLVILDDVQNIFQAGGLAGQYLPGYEDYGKFFKQVATSPHQSCVILLSWEKPRDFTVLEGENLLSRTLHLQGLGETAKEILRAKRLADEEKWSDLITFYQGHPCWLNIIASTIWELFDGSVSLFLEDKDDNIFLGDLEPLLEAHLERLSPLEAKVSDWLASQAEVIDLSQPSGARDFSKSELWQAIQSLARRGLVEKVQVGARSLFLLNPVFKQYIQSS